MQLYINDVGKPVIPKCGNCVHWMKLNSQEKNVGYCKLIKLLFAFTRKSNVYAITKDFYYCEKQELVNLDILKEKGQMSEFSSIEEATSLLQKK
jgi:hypothetical protein